MIRSHERRKSREWAHQANADEIKRRYLAAKYRRFYTPLENRSRCSGHIGPSPGVSPALTAVKRQTHENSVKDEGFNSREDVNEDKSIVSRCFYLISLKKFEAFVK